MVWSTCERCNQDGLVICFRYDLNGGEHVFRCDCHKGRSSGLTGVPIWDATKQGYRYISPKGYFKRIRLLELFATEDFRFNPEYITLVKDLGRDEVIERLEKFKLQKRKLENANYKYKTKGVKIE